MPPALPPDRLKKLEALRAEGIPPYPNDFRPSKTIAEARAGAEGVDAAVLEAKGEEIALAGRLLSLRPMGKSTFGHLEDRSGRLQAFFKKDLLGDGPRGYGLLDLVDLGDFLGVRGTLMRTRMGELSVLVREVRLLAKALRPLPEKWHGLKDVEARYRSRSLDLIANPRVKEIFRDRARIVAFLRSFLAARDFIEVETPMMQPVPGGATARPFVTHHHALDLDLYLRVAPELYLKRLVVGGLERVFEINRNFRNEGVSSHHNPEFTMLEFYQAYATYEDLMRTTEEMVSSLAREIRGSTIVPWDGKTFDLAPPWERVSFVEALLQGAERSGARGLALDQVLDAEGLRDFCARHLASGPVASQVGKTYGGWLSGAIPADLLHGRVLDVLFKNWVEEALPSPCFLVEYPLALSPLARRNEADPRLVDRFELFIGGMEIANAFSELNDAIDQRERLDRQAAAKAGGDEEAHPVDEDFLRALEQGMPPTAGEGIGIDRLAMLLTGAPSIREVILFPLLRPER